MLIPPLVLVVVQKLVANMTKLVQSELLLHFVICGILYGRAILRCSLLPP